MKGPGLLSLTLVKPGGKKFLLIEDNLDNRFLLTRTMARKFPDAEICECGDSTAAVELAASKSIDAIILHRADLADGIELIGEVRQVNPRVPIIMVSSFDRTREALAAGATRFLSYEEWLRIGLVTADVLATEPYAAGISALTFALERRFTVKLSHLTGAGQNRASEVEPHLLGQDARGRFAVRAYAVASGTRNPLRSGWATYYLEGLKTVTVTQRLFAPHHEDEMHDAEIVQVRCEIDGTASGFIPRRIVKTSER